MTNLGSYKLDILNFEIVHGKLETFKLDTPDLGFGHGRPKTFNLNTLDPKIGHGIFKGIQKNTLKLDIKTYLINSLLKFYDLNKLKWATYDNPLMFEDYQDSS
jgi:hypothetical protein